MKTKTSLTLTKYPFSMYALFTWETAGLCVRPLEEPADVGDGEARGFAHQDHFVSCDVGHAVWSSQDMGS